MNRVLKKVAVVFASFIGTREWAWVLAGILIGCGLVNFMAQQWNNAFCCGLWALSALLEIKRKTIVLNYPPDAES